MRKKRTTTRLRDMKPQIALAYVANLTRLEWIGMDNDNTRAIWRVFRDYIYNEFQGVTAPVPDGIRDVWDRCKPLIDKEARR